MSTIWIHEDDWAMRCLHPLGAREEVLADMDEAAALDERSKVAEGIWSEIHLIESPDIDYVTAGLRLSDAAAALAPFMPRVTAFHAGTSWSGDGRPPDPFSVHEENAWCYGYDEDCFIKLETRESLVRDIWFEHRTRDQERATALRRSIEAIDSLVPSILADHHMGVEGICGDPQFLDDYFADRESNLAVIEEKWGKR